MAKQHGFAQYNRGEEANLAMEFLGIFCCSIPLILVSLGVYKAASQILQDAFPEDTLRHVLFALFPFAGALVLDPILTKKEQELGISNVAPNMKMLGLASFVCFITVPLYTAALIQRLNAIDAAANK